MPEVLFAYAIAALLVAIVFVIALVLGRASAWCFAALRIARAFSST